MNPCTYLVSIAEENENLEPVALPNIDEVGSEVWLACAEKYCDPGNMDEEEAFKTSCPNVIFECANFQELSEARAKIAELLCRYEGGIPLAVILNLEVQGRPVDDWKVSVHCWKVEVAPATPEAAQGVTQRIGADFNMGENGMSGSMTYRIVKNRDVETAKHFTATATEYSTWQVGRTSAFLLFFEG